MGSERIFHIDELGVVRIRKKKGVKRLSLRMHSSGEVRVTQPYYAPFRTGLQFAMSHASWVEKQRATQGTLKLYDALPIGKGHTLHIRPSDTLRTRVTETDILVYTTASAISDQTPEELRLTKKAIKRALHKQATHYMPQRVQELATKYGYSFTNIHVKSLKTRWGSCSNKQELTFNYYLMMLPDNCIDYVIMHELAHTKHMHHGDGFWSEVASTTPHYLAIKKELKKLQPNIHLFYE